MSVAIETGGLTKTDISVLRRADEYLIQNRDGQNFIGAVKRAKYDDPFDSDKRVEILIDGNGADGCFSYHPNLSGIANGVLRVGDILTVEWYPGGGTNGHLKDADLICDLVYLHVRRGNRSFKFLVDQQVTPPSSMSRLCRRMT